jgi:hypothetical protein
MAAAGCCAHATGAVPKSMDIAATVAVIEFHFFMGQFLLMSQKRLKRMDTYIP